MTRRVGIITVDYAALATLLRIPVGQTIIGLAPQTAEHIIHGQLCVLVEGHGLPHIEQPAQIPWVQWIKAEDVK